MFPLVLLEDTINDMKGGRSHHDVVMKKVIGENVDSFGWERDIPPESE